MAEYRKMNGEWGIVGADGEIVPGARVRVVRRDGRVSYETVGRVLWRRGGRAGAEKVPEGKAAAPQAPAAAQVTEAPAAPQRSEGFCPGCGRRLYLPLPVARAVPCPGCARLIGHLADVNEGPAPDYTPPVQAPAAAPGLADVVIGGASLQTVDRDGPASERIMFVCYYIPSDAELDNPAGIFRRRGFRIDEGGSVYAVPASRLPWDWIDRANRTPGATVTIAQFDQSEAPALRQLCLSVLERQVARQRESLATSLANFDAQLAGTAGGTDEERVLARKRYETNARAALRRMEELLADVSEAAGGFGHDLCGLTLPAREMVSAMRAGVATRAAVYMDMAQQVAGTEMGPAALTADVPAGVLADFLEDQGADVGAVRDVFVN